jgi:hypothetical protein
MRAAHKFKTNRKTHRSVTRHVANPRANAPHRAMSARHVDTAHTARANTATHANRDAKNTKRAPSFSRQFFERHRQRHAPSMRASMPAMMTWVMREGGSRNTMRRARGTTDDATRDGAEAPAPGVRRPRVSHSKRTK